MKYLALASDYDGTLAADGKVLPRTVDAVLRLRASGRRAMMVTGREVPDLHATFERVDAFDLVVAENGGVILDPATGVVKRLGEPPNDALVAALVARGVRLSVGMVIIATWAEFHDAVGDAVKSLGLERAVDVIVNKDAVMILPLGINKGTGVLQAAHTLGIPLPQIVGIGDAENDYSLLHACGLGVAVANAVPSLKAMADLVTAGARGEGVAQIVDRLLADDLAGVAAKPRGEIGVVVHEAEARED